MTAPDTAPLDGQTTFLVTKSGIAREKRTTPVLDEEATRIEVLHDRAIGHRWPSFEEADRVDMVHYARPLKVPAEMPAVDAFKRVATNCLAQISANAQLVRTGNNRDALHQTRIGLRRLRAAFTAFRDILPINALDRWKKETKWLEKELDGARDLDVFGQHVSHWKSKKPHKDAMQTMFGGRLLMMQAAAYELVLTAIGSNRFAAFLHDCAEWVGPTAWQAAEHREVATLRDEASLAAASRALERLHHRLRKAGGHLMKLDSAGRHSARIAAKNLRYTAEFFAGTFDKSRTKHRRRYIQSLTELQDALGTLNDLAMIQRCACTLAGSNAELAFQAGQMIGSQEKEQARLLGKAMQSYAGWLEAKPFWG
jgi:CHAD domain-containing protein